MFAIIIAKTKCIAKGLKSTLDLRFSLPCGSDHRVVASYSELYEEGEVDHINCLARFPAKFTASIIFIEATPLDVVIS
jgi:hypothetical protein